MKEIKIHFYNTLSRKLEEFKEIQEGKVGIYSCGPTVYHYQHLGNMRAVVFADTIRRLLVTAGYDVTHIINITDVGHIVDDTDTGEDKMEKGAVREGKSVWEIAQLYTDDYFKCLDLLHIPRDAYFFPKATDHIEEQIKLIQDLEAKGHSYTLADGIYFDTKTFPSYADFAKLNIEGLRNGARVEEHRGKRNSTDFALWKFSPSVYSTDKAQTLVQKRQMEWISPWGVGFPGWHIECSAMSMKYLGNHFDIHTGGKEHVTVHHTNEIAQSEAATGTHFVNYWLHYDWLSDSRGKMAKSSGDFLRLQSILDKDIDPLAFRYYLLTAHYRTEQMFSFEALTGSAVAYKKLCDLVTEWSHFYKESNENPDRETMLSYYKALFNDVGTPQALAILWNMVKDEKLNDKIKYRTILAMDMTLGLGFKDIKKDETPLSETISLLLEERLAARKANNYAKSDEIRDTLADLGYLVKDSKDGQVVSSK